MTKLEKDIEAKLRQAVGSAGGLCLKWVCPGWAGVPDRIVLLPGGRIVFVEVKRPKGGTLSPIQKWWAKGLVDLGFAYEQVWDEVDLAYFKAVHLKKPTKE